jgi:hypothetical protein
MKKEKVDKDLKKIRKSVKPEVQKWLALSDRYKLTSENVDMITEFVSEIILHKKNVRTGKVEQIKVVDKLSDDGIRIKTR